MNRPRRPLGWWDTGVARTATPACVERRKKILRLLAGLPDAPESRQIAELSHQILNLAQSRSEMGDEAGARRLHKGLARALARLAAGRCSPREFFQISASAEALTPTTRPPADAGGAQPKDTSCK
jgi:hypothetical protein